MIRAMRRVGGSPVDTSLVPADFAASLADPRSLLWVDFSDEPDASCEAILRDTFGFHPLAIDDAIRESHVPKVDDWGKYLYLVLHGVSLEFEGGETLETRELDIFLGPNYLVTHHEQPLECLEEVWSASLKDERMTGGGAARLLYHLVDELVAGHMPVVDALDEEMERIEEQALESSGRQVLERVLGIKRSLLHLRRVIAPQRETLGKLAREGYAAVEPSSRVYFRDIYDHLVRLYDITENMRDLAGGALEIYLSVINNRMNEVMKTFTLITTLFMPISFLTGFFGMNFFTATGLFSGWTGRAVFTALCGAFVLVPVLMLLWLKRRRWV
jgi:magnesium transporter